MQTVTIINTLTTLMKRVLVAPAFRRVCRSGLLLMALLCWGGSVLADETYCFMVYSGSTYYYMRSAGVDGSGSMRYGNWYNDSTGFFGPHVYAPKETWTWRTGTNGTKDNANRIFETSVDLSNLGRVFGTINLTIKGTSNIHGDVFGGCDMSTANANVITRISGPVRIGGSVYGGGNEAKVVGNTTVKVGEN
ncbi:MAG: hypothetical protein K6E93_07170 [Bacteroidales bacterium]|nr:hypothetical protein [Bacteroidales bacterium]